MKGSGKGKVFKFHLLPGLTCLVWQEPPVVFRAEVLVVNRYSVFGPSITRVEINRLMKGSRMAVASSAGIKGESRRPSTADT